MLLADLTTFQGKDGKSRSAGARHAGRNLALRACVQLVPGLLERYLPMLPRREGKKMGRKPHVAASATSNLMDKAIRYVLSSDAERKELGPLIEKVSGPTYGVPVRRSARNGRTFRSVRSRPFRKLRSRAVSAGAERMGNLGASLRTTCQQFQFPGEQAQLGKLAGPQVPARQSRLLRPFHL